jgi:hypothetical protein
MKKMLATVTTALVATAAVALATAGAAPALAGTAAPSASATVSMQTGTPALAQRVATGIQPGFTAAKAAGPATVPSRPHGARRLTADAPAAVAPAAVASPSTATDPAALLASFNGTSSRDSEVTNFNARVEPPDQGLCEGAGFIIEPVNSAYRIMKTSGQTIRGPFNINELFNEGGKEFTSDPRCWYDPNAHAWFATIVFLNDTFTASRIDLAVNLSDDPTGLWNEYQIDTNLGGRDGEPNLSGCPCYGDQPRIGIDQTNLYITTDAFSIRGPQYHGGQIYAIAKSDLLAGGPTAHFVRFGNLRAGGAVSGAPQPALSIGSPDAEYFLGQIDPSGTSANPGDHRISVWAMTNRGRVATGGSPTLSKVVIESEPYVQPAEAPQKGATSTIDSGDTRMQQVSYVARTVWGELGTGLGSANQAAAAWFQVKPRLNGTKIGGASILRQGYLTNPDGALLYPAIQPDAAGNAAMVFTLTGKRQFPSVGFSLLKAGGAQFATPALAAAGTGPYDVNATRWGDYSFAVPDPTSDTAWLATEYIPPVPSQTSNGARNWGTRVIHVKLG